MKAGRSGEPFKVTGCVGQGPGRPWVLLIAMRVLVSPGAVPARPAPTSSALS